MPATVRTRSSGLVRRAAPPLRRHETQIGHIRQVWQAHPMIEVTMEDLVSILLAAELGHTAEVQDLYDDMLDRDVHLQAVYGKRRHNIASRELLLKPPKGYEDDADAKENVRICEQAWADFEDPEGLILDMTDAIGRGWAVDELEWGTSREGWWMPKRAHWVHANRISWDVATMTPLRYDVGVDTWPGTPLETVKGGPDGFVFHSPRSLGVYPTRRGLLRSASWLVLIKRYGLRWWTVGIERFGIPGLWAEVLEGDDELKEKALEFLRSLAADWAAVATAGFKVNTIENSGSFDGTGHEKLCRYVDEQHSKQFLGQTLTTDAPTKGGSRAQGDVHADVELALEHQDGRMIASDLRRDFFRPVVKYNRPGTPVPVAFFSRADDLAEIPSHYFAAPIVRRNEARKSIGLPPVTGPEGEEYVVQAQPVDAGPSFPGRPIDRTAPREEPAPVEPAPLAVRTRSESTPTSSTSRSGPARGFSATTAGPGSSSSASPSASRRRAPSGPSASNGTSRRGRSARAPAKPN